MKKGLDDIMEYNIWITVFNSFLHRLVQNVKTIRVTSRIFAILGYDLMHDSVW